MAKSIIWIIGSIASGKSTQRRMICDTFQTIESPMEISSVGDVNYHYTTFGEVAAIGKCKQNADNQCDGLDASFGRLKKVGGLLSVELAIKDHEIVVLEGSQTSLMWFEELQRISADFDSKLYLVHLSLSDEENMQRLKFRQQQKKGIEVELTEKNIESIKGKNQQFRNIYNKLKDKCDSIQINAFQSKDKIFREIIEFCIL